jgi:hypothetical protein
MVTTMSFIISSSISIIKVILPEKVTLRLSSEHFLNEQMWVSEYWETGE